MSDGPRSCNLTDNLNNKKVLSFMFQDKKFIFPSLSSIEATIENIFMSQISSRNYESDNFQSFIEDNNIVICLQNHKLIFQDESSVDDLENALCKLYTENSLI